MYAREILVRALDCIANTGYVTKDHALIHDLQSTAQRVLSSLESEPSINATEEALYGAQANSILDWITTYYVKDNDYLANCLHAVELADTAPHKAAGFLVSLPSAYARFLDSSKGLDKVKVPNGFAGDKGDRIACAAEIINVQHLKGYHRISMVDDIGHLITYTQSEGKKALTLPTIGDKVYVTGAVSKNLFRNIFETVLFKPTLTAE